MGLINYVIRYTAAVENSKWSKISALNIQLLLEGVIVGKGAFLKIKTT